MRRVLTLAGAALSMAAVALSSTGAAGPSSSAVNVGGQDLVAPTHWVAHRNTGTASSSLNWAGYVQHAANGTFTGVTATFLVTTVNTHVSGDQYSADWVGIGGFDTAKLVQAGIEEDNLGGTAFYQAWTEILPKSEVPLTGLVLAPGNRVTVTVRQTATARDKKKRWSMTVTDDTTGKSAGRVVRYTASEDSVEAIHERPCLGAPCSNNLATLAATTNQTFDPAYYTSSAPNVTAVYQPLLSPPLGATLYDIDMLGNNGITVVATPSAADTDHIGFAVADGSNAPAAPSP